MIVNCRRLRNILSFLPYLSVNCICASLPKIVDRIRHEKGEAPRAGLPKIIYTTYQVLKPDFLNEKIEQNKKLSNKNSNIIFRTKSLPAWFRPDPPLLRSAELFRCRDSRSDRSCCECPKRNS